MSETRNILEDSVNRLFSDELDWDALAKIEQEGFPQSLWDQVTEQGLHLVLASEQAGGMGAGWGDAYAVMRECGRHAVPLPVVEALIAYGLASAANMPLPAGIPGLIDKPLVVEGGQVSLSDVSVPWGAQAAYLMGMQPSQGGSQLVLLDTADDRTRA